MENNRFEVWEMVVNNTKLPKEYVSDVDWTKDTLKELYERKLNMEKEYNFTPQLAFANIELHLKMWAEQTNAKNFVVGISGGKDSTVVAMLLCAIFGKERVWGVQLPQDLQKDYDDAKDVIDVLGINRYVLNIGGAVSDIERQIIQQRKMYSVYPTKDMEINLPARI